MKLGLSPGTSTHNAPPQLQGHGRRLPEVTPESGSLVVLPGVYPSPNLHGFNSLVSGQIPVVWLGIFPVWGLSLPPTGLPPLALKHRTPQVSV